MFAVDARFKGDGKYLGLSSVTAYAQTVLNDNWKVGMKLQPALNFGGFKQEKAIQVGVTGKVCDKTQISAVVNHGTDTAEAVLTATYHPNDNIDFSATQTYNLNELK